MGACLRARVFEIHGHPHFSPTPGSEDGHESAPQAVPAATLIPRRADAGALPAA